MNWHKYRNPHRFTDMFVLPQRLNLKMYSAKEVFFYLFRSFTINTQKCYERHSNIRTQYFLLRLSLLILRGRFAVELRILSFSEQTGILIRDFSSRLSMCLCVCGEKNHAVPTYTTTSFSMCWKKYIG